MPPSPSLLPVTVSIVVPMRNEAAQMPALLAHLQALSGSGSVEVLLVDGASEDDSCALAEAAGFRVVHSPPGRARQMNAGAAEAEGGLLVFLHADTRLPPVSLEALGATLSQSGHCWGRFDVVLEGRSRWLPLVAAMMNLRSRLTGIATGDQALFIERKVFEALGGFPDQPLMEDIEMSRQLKKRSRPFCPRDKARTSGRRWDQRGALRTIGLMWQLRWAYWRGADPQTLLERYR